MTRIHRSLLLVFVLAIVAICAANLFAQDEYIYANNASATLSPYVYKIDVSPGSAGKIVQTYTNLSGINGRGVAVVGTTMYYTALSSNCVFSYNLGLQIDNGCLFKVTDGLKTVTGLGSVAYDGANLWIQEMYGGSVGSVFEYTIVGIPTYVTKVNPAKCSGATTPCDGLEYVNSPIASCTGNLLIANRGDALDPYDAYTTSGGASCHPAFITPTNRNSGIAWDGTFFYTAALFKKQLEVFNSAGVAQPTITLSGAPPGFPPLIEDLSVDYCQGVNAWTINFGFAVSNAFTVPPQPPVATHLDFVYWDPSTTDLLTSVDMQIGSTSFGGTTHTFVVENRGLLGFNCLGYALQKARISFTSETIAPGGYVTLSNACTTSGCSVSTPIYWDQSSGSPTAYSNGNGSLTSCATGSCPPNPIPPETFQFIFP